MILVPIVFQASYVIYLYNIYIYIYIYISVQCLSLPAYICPMPVTIGVHLSNACYYRRIFVQRLSLSAHICSKPVQNHQTRFNCKCFSMIWKSSADLLDLPDLPEVSYLLRFGTSSTRAGGQDDLSSNQLWRRSDPSASPARVWSILSSHCPLQFYYLSSSFCDSKHPPSLHPPLRG